MNIFEFMSDSPWLTGFIIIIILSLTVECVLKYCINRPLRHANIRKHGWPPSHCDADGDFKKEKEDQ